MAAISKSMSPTSTRDSLRPKSHLPDGVRILLRNPVSVAGTLIMLVFVAIALLAPLLAPPAILSQPFQIPRDGFQAEPQPPSPAYPLGTTQGQYDLNYGIIWGTRTAFEIGLVVTGLTVLIGGSLGG